MKIPPARRLDALGAYAFAAVKESVARLKAEGIAPIDFGVGDHTLPSPVLARERLKSAVDEFATAGYPSYVGSRAFREAVAAWTERRFGVRLDPNTQLCSTIGSKEGVFNLPEAFVDPGDLVIVPTPGYPPYVRGTQFAEGVPYFVPVAREHDFLIDFEAIPKEVAARAKLLWICYPNSPTGKQAPREFFERAVAFCDRHDVLLCSDEAYSEIYFDEARKPPSVLEITDDNVLAIFSMSKRSMMTGWRIGWVAGDRAAVSAFKKLKTNVDSGTPDFIQAGAIAALEDEAHVAAMRAETRKKRDVLADALLAAGLADCRPDATLYLWQRAPEGMSSQAFAQALLVPQVALVTTPGAWISEPLADGTNPGEGYVRFALVPPLEAVQEAARRLAHLSF